MFRLIAASVFFTICLACIQAYADASGPNAADHAPIGVMGDHMHEKGEFMLSYRFLHMDMQGNRAGADGIEADTIVTTVPNRFFGRPMQPPTLRIVPTSMSMDMHMFGAMYAPADWLTLMVMGMYMEKEMEHTTYMDGMGTTVRVPYAMQLGSGTYDLPPGITYNGHSGKVYWGGQYMGTFRLGENHGYSLGDKHTLSAWLNYQWRPFISTHSSNSAPGKKVLS